MTMRTRTNWRCKWMQRTSKRWRQDEVELDETLYTEKMTVKELQLACKERQLEANEGCLTV